MSPVEVALVVACVVLLGVAAVAVTTMRALARDVEHLDRSVDRLREEIEELSRREAAREVAETESRALADRPREADWVITGIDDERAQVPTSAVVSTTLGEPLIKVAAFSHGVRRALREEKRAHLAFQVRREYRRRRRASRARVREAQRRSAR